MAREQIEKVENSGAEEVLVHCPHCYTVLKDVYPLLGARFTVTHTSEFFEDVIHKERLQIQGLPRATSVRYHDPCFLGRYQEITEPPRKILNALPGLELRDLPRSGREGYCCGAGGGHFFMDLDLQERPSSQRLEEILKEEPEILAVSCGFCFSMFDDALRRLPEPSSLRIADWLELLEEAAVRGKR
jgi:Fe-S oxidoreductase